MWKQWKGDIFLIRHTSTVVACEGYTSNLSFKTCYQSILKFPYVMKKLSSLNATNFTLEYLNFYPFFLSILLRIFFALDKIFQNYIISFISIVKLLFTALLLYNMLYIYFKNTLSNKKAINMKSLVEKKEEILIFLAKYKKCGYIQSKSV